MPSSERWPVPCSPVGLWVIASHPRSHIPGVDEGNKIRHRDQKLQVAPVGHSIGDASQNELAHAVGIANHGAHTGTGVDGHPFHIWKRVRVGAQVTELLGGKRLHFCPLPIVFFPKALWMPEVGCQGRERGDIAWQ